MRRSVPPPSRSSASSPSAAQAAPAPVVGGTRAAQGEFPFMVRLSMGCGGALYTQDRAHRRALRDGTGANTSITATAGVVDLQSTSGRPGPVHQGLPGPRLQRQRQGLGAHQARPPINLPTLKIATTTRTTPAPSPSPGGARPPRAAASSATCSRPPCRSSPTPPARPAYGSGLVPGEEICAGTSPPAASTPARVTPAGRCSAGTTPKPGSRSASSAGARAAPGPTPPASTPRCPPSPPPSPRPPPRSDRLTAVTPHPGAPS